MNIATTTRLICSALVFLAVQFPAVAGGGFTDADADSIKAFLQDKFLGKNVGMVIGLLDKNGSRIFGAGKLDDGTDREVNGDTIFEIGSITKTFTTLLLVDMVERGDLKLDDPVAKYLPGSVKMPGRGGKEITLLGLATHTSGLPRDVQNMVSQNRGNPFDYTPEQLYAFLSDYQLSNDPGAKFEYSNVGMGLLGHAIALKTGKDYETLVVERICRPLRMDSTRATLTPELKARFATGHDQAGKRIANYDFAAQAMAGCGALRSTAKDLLKYLSANIGLVPSNQTGPMEKTHVIRHKDSPNYGNTAMDWMDRGEVYPPDMELLGHGGGTAGYWTFIGFDKIQRRGVVVLCNQQGGISPETLGWLLLEGVRLTPQLTGVLLPVSQGDLGGVGMKLELGKESHLLQIAGFVPDSPAAQAGLPAGLTLQAVDGIPTAGKGMIECLSLIRGRVGTKVRLELVDPKQKETNTVELIRQKITISK